MKYKKYVMFEWKRLIKNFQLLFFSFFTDVLIKLKNFN